MNPIEILAVIFSVLVLIKLIVIVIRPKVWLDNVVKPIYNNNVVSMLVFGIVTLISGYYLLQVMNIVVLGAVALFVSFLMALNFLLFPKETLKLSELMLKKDNVGKFWFLILVWAVFALWVLKEIFMR